MRVRGFALTAALGLALVVAACGTSTVASAFVAKADAICASYRAQIDALPAQANTAHSALTLIRAVATLAEATQTKLESLTAPSGEHAAYAKALAADAQTISVLKEERADIIAGNSAAFNALVNGPQQRLGASAYVDFQAIGLKQCAQSTRPGSTPHFAAKASAICTTTDKQVEALPTPAHTLQSLEKSAGAELLLIRGEVSKLEQLTPPPSKRAIFLAALSLMNEETAIDQRAIFAAGNKAESAKLATKARSIGAALDTFLVRLGIAPCEG